MSPGSQLYMALYHRVQRTKFQTAKEMWYPLMSVVLKWSSGREKEVIKDERRLSNFAR